MDLLQHYHSGARIFTRRIFTVYGFCTRRIDIPIIKCALGRDALHRGKTIELRCFSWVQMRRWAKRSVPTLLSARGNLLERYPDVWVGNGEAAVAHPTR